MIEPIVDDDAIGVAPLHQGQYKRHRYVEEVRALLARFSIFR